MYSEGKTAFSAKLLAKAIETGRCLVIEKVSLSRESQRR